MLKRQLQSPYLFYAFGTIIFSSPTQRQPQSKYVWVTYHNDNYSLYISPMYLFSSPMESNWIAWKHQGVVVSCSENDVQAWINVWYAGNNFYNIITEVTQTISCINCNSYFKFDCNELGVSKLELYILELYIGFNPFEITHVLGKMNTQITVQKTKTKKKLIW